MPFNHLLFGALQPGKTLAEDRENKGYTSAQLEAAAEETVLLFRSVHSQEDRGTERGIQAMKACNQ
jgi:hypothetical protein